jgi:hypothetical protein
MGGGHDMHGHNGGVKGFVSNLVHGEKGHGGHGYEHGYGHGYPPPAAGAYPPPHGGYPPAAYPAHSAQYGTYTQRQIVLTTDDFYGFSFYTVFSNVKQIINRSVRARGRAHGVVPHRPRRLRRRPPPRRLRRRQAQGRRHVRRRQVQEMEVERAAADA